MLIWELRKQVSKVFYKQFGFFFNAGTILILEIYWKYNFNIYLPKRYYNMAVIR